MSNKIHPKGDLEAHPLALIFPRMDATEFGDLRESVRLHGLRDDIVLLNGMVLDGVNRYSACLDEGIAPSFVNYNHDVDGKFPIDYVLDKNQNRRQLSLSQRAAAAAAAIPHLELAAKERQKATQFKVEVPKPAPVESVPPAADDEELPSAPGTTTGTTTAVVPTPTPTPTPEPAPALAAGAAGGQGSAPSAPAAGGSAPAPTPGKNDGKSENKGAVVDLVAKMFGTSRTMVGQAKRIQKADPDLYQQVLAGKITVNAAIQKVEEADKAKKDTANKALEKQQRADALAKIADKYGMESQVYIACQKKKVFKPVADLVAFAEMKPKDTTAIFKLAVEGWSFDKAKRYLEGKITLENTIEDAINTAIARGEAGQPYPIVVGKWTLTLTHAG